MYNQELTVRLIFDPLWIERGDAVTVRQGDSVRVYTVKHSVSTGELYINLDALPDGGTIYVIKN